MHSMHFRQEERNQEGEAGISVVSKEARERDEEDIRVNVKESVKL